MQTAEYPARRAGQVEIAQAMQALGLRPDWRLADRRPPPADTFDEQTARIAMSREVVRLVRQRMPITNDERYLLYRLVDRAMAERERQTRPAVAPAMRNVTDEECIAYAAAGGGAWGTFAAFRRRFAGDPVVPEPAVAVAPAAAPPAPPRRPSGPRPAPAPAPKRRTAPPLVIARRVAAHG